MLQSPRMIGRRLLLPLAFGLLFGCGAPQGAFASSQAPPPKAVPRAAASEVSKKPETGIASWFRAKRALVGAHRTLPLGSKVRVVARNGRSVVVTVGGRGPFVKGRVIDLSSDAFKKLASLGTGLLHVRLELVPPAPKKISRSP